MPPHFRKGPKKKRVSFGGLIAAVGLKDADFFLPFAFRTRQSRLKKIRSTHGPRGLAAGRAEGRTC